MDGNLRGQYMYIVVKMRDLGDKHWLEVGTDYQYETSDISDAFRMCNLATGDAVIFNSRDQTKYIAVRDGVSMRDGWVPCPPYEYSKRHWSR